jgi:hypothetical protein
VQLGQSIEGIGVSRRRDEQIGLVRHSGECFEQNRPLAGRGTSASKVCLVYRRPTTVSTVVSVPPRAGILSLGRAGWYTADLTRAKRR